MTDDFERDFRFGKLEFHNATNEEDRKEGIDGWIGIMPVATRKFRKSISAFGQISIRRRKLFKSEYEKILSGEFKPILYIFEWPDAYAIYRVVDIKACLEMEIFKYKANPGGLTGGCYINFDELPHLLIFKEA